LITRKELAERIKNLRKDFGLSQDGLAERLDLPRPSISQIESNQREISSMELIKIAKIFGMSVDELLSSQKETTCKSSKSLKIPSINKDKFKQVLLYILEKCGAKPNVGETVVYKLLYFIDTNFYELYEEYLTGESYRKIDHGPAPCHFSKIIDEMIESEEVKKVVTEYYGMLQKKYIPQIKPNLSKLNGKEIEVMDFVIERLSSMNARSIEDYSHCDIPCDTADDREIIDFETVFYRAPAYSVREYLEE